MDSDPPPDIVVEIDVTNESLSKFPIYAGLGVPEIWRYDGGCVQMYALKGETYTVIGESRFFPGLTSSMLFDVLEIGKAEGQTAAVQSARLRFRDRT